jgi:hypothetical protein
MDNMMARIDNKSSLLRRSVCIMLFFLVFSPASIFPGAEERVLVLGFRSSMLSDLEDRILRETIMRELVERGHEIISVMDLEGFFSEYPKHIRKISEADLGTLCNKLGASYAVSGSIARNGRRSVVSVIIYGRERNLIHRRRISLGSGEFHEFCYSLADEIGIIIGEIMVP